MIGCACPVCLSPDPKDKRLRSSVWLQDDNLSILIDTTPDLRMQALRAGMTQLDAVILTHAHNDHLIGFDDLRRFCDNRSSPLPIHCSKDTHQRLLTVFSYAFENTHIKNNYVQAIAHVFDNPFTIGSLRVIPVEVPHGKTLTYGFIFEKNGRRLAAYIPDCAEITDAVAAQLRDLPILILDGLRDKLHPTHLTVAQAIEAGHRVNAGALYLTHISHDFFHDQRQALLPANVFLAYDELVLNLD